MRNRLFFLSIIFLGVLLIQGSIYADKGHVVFVSGKVEVENKGRWVQARLDMMIEEASRIRTGKNGLIILRLGDGAIIKLKASSQIILSKLDNHILIDVESGAIFSRLQKLRADQSYKIRAQTFVAAVRGTEFFFTYGRRKKEGADYWLCVNEGIVNVTESEKASNADVQAGEGVHAPIGKKIDRPRHYEWTKKLNWNMDAARGPVDDKVDISDAYGELLKRTYD